MSKDDRNELEKLSDAKWLSDQKAIQELPVGNKKEQKIMKRTKNVGPQDN